MWLCHRFHHLLVYVIFFLFRLDKETAFMTSGIFVLFLAWTTVAKDLMVKSKSNSSKANLAAMNHTNSTCKELSTSVVCFDLVTPEVREFRSNFDAPSESETVDRVDYEFVAFGKRIYLRLHRILESDIIPPWTEIRTISSKGEKRYLAKDLDLGFFQGSEVGENTSYAHGTFIKGEFDGTLKTIDEVYFIEPAWKYPEIGQKGDKMAVIYRRSDVRYPKRVCGSSREREYFPKTSFANKNLNFTSRRRRGVGNVSRTCELFIMADHTFYQFSGFRNLETTVSEIVYHVTEADYIFRMTDFDGDSFGDNVGFRISKLNIVQDILAPHYNMRSMTLDIEEYLHQYAKYTFDKYCLSTVFTFRDFSKGSIGLAFTAGPTAFSAPGGLCEKRLKYSLGGVVDHYSFNSLLVSQANNGQKLPKEVVALTLTHELGHSFGSPHDDETEDISCFPGKKSPSGNFVMFSMNAGIERKNNWQFSHCSRSFIAPVVQNKGSCLIINNPPVCGNMQVEAPEECDCGNAYSCENVDRCCTPVPIYTGNSNSQYPGCTIARDSGSHCSPKSKLCCDNNCKIIPQSNTVCRPGTDCTLEAWCDGRSDSCPYPIFKSDGIVCGGGSGRCRMGICNISLCQMNGLVDCLCNMKAAACRICCGCTIDNQTSCIPADWIGLTSNTRMYHLPGYPCDNGRGSCNADGMCWALSFSKRSVRVQGKNNSCSQRISSNSPAYNWLNCYAYFGFYICLAFLLDFSITL